ncbi:hypothetical protein VST7929_01641 [Vibrio stylophorae]|uniref:Uncharacterized protein n=1 Tax=Vibrio stylophorae TaxID=659351 RepID=A0ABM8ZTX3_9VIBR|nr:hypothetical protein [Vibrio stylophorae]CAH0533766.1 hypothetical protein VST7929_01641 [Vibrio stylophorae]
MMRNGILACCLWLSGCTTHAYFDQKADIEPNLAKTPYVSVYVFNAQAYPQEYQWLKQANVYQLVDEHSAIFELKLKPAQLLPAYLCGTGQQIQTWSSALSLGLMPIEQPATLYFQYQLIRDGQSTHYVHAIPMLSRTSLWETLMHPWVPSEVQAEIKGLQSTPRALVAHDAGF